MSVRVRVTLQGLKCQRCGHVWVPRTANPKKCAGCGSPYWRKKARPYHRKS
jgi:uncharacterized OB-fold protein